MRNNIASFEKTSRCRVKIMGKINAEFISALNFVIYLLADKAKYGPGNQCLQSPF